MEKINAYAKINITLDVTGRLPNGYHTIKSVMQQVDLCDEVTVECFEEPGIILTVESECEGMSAAGHELVPCDEKNIAYRAAKAILTEAENRGLKVPGVRVHLKKRIPAAAGLAGGSTDAAAALTGINEACGFALSTEELCAIGKTIGADVPFCIKGGTVLCEGIGEKMTDLPGLPAIPVIIAKPDVAVSTAEGYAGLDKGLEEGTLKHPDTDGLAAVIEKIEQHDVSKAVDSLIPFLGNVFAPMTEESRPVIADIRQTMIESGAAGALMSGSGPSVFALFRDEASAEKSEAALKEQFPEIFIYRGKLRG
ncbi:MAG: 4-(cytidine 5'-diphospho)-2-C-methyl-D-erythritol kinase [Lachnospiraceae bacterium]|nr:4-(cytidine 5'-diphospho)-2-C-methyl-D-erythritol kinase [Lachnospiraceae bacterium]